MARAPNENLEKAYKLYKKGLKLVEISKELDIPPGTIRRWKSTYKWNNERSEKDRERSNKKGGQPNNKNAEKHGFFSKYLPEDTFDIIQNIEIKKPLDILWDNIKLQYAAIIRAQRIMYVKSIDDKTIEKIEERNGDSSYGEKWEVQQAWDKQANFLNAQSRAMKTLEGMIKQYDEMINKNWNLVTEEQKARIEVLKSKIVNNEKSKEDKIDEYFAKLENEIIE